MKAILVCLIVYVLVVAALGADAPSAGGREVFIWIGALLIAASIAGLMLLSPAAQFIIGVSGLAAALVVLPLEWYLGTPEQRLKRAYARRSQLPVLATDSGRLFPLHAPWDYAFGLTWLNSERGQILPLSGLSNRLIGLCTADGMELAFSSDEYGFRNPRGLHADRADVVLIGDSFAQGYCVDDHKSIGGLVRSHFPRTVNLGVTGAGPLWELGVFREYAAALQPSAVVWLFFEGNDLMSLEVEAAGFAARYLKKGFSQNLGDRQTEVDSILLDRADSILATYDESFSARLRRLALLREVRARLQLNYRPAAGKAHNQGGIEQNLEALRGVLTRAVAESRAWNGRVLFAYLPDFHRFSADLVPPSGKDTSSARGAKEKVLEVAAESGAEVLDLTVAFSALGDPLSAWDDGQVHYNVYGYGIVADSIVTRLRRGIPTDHSPARALPAQETTRNLWIPVARTNAWVRKSLAR